MRFIKRKIKEDFRNDEDFYDYDKEYYPESEDSELENSDYAADGSKTGVSFGMLCK